MSQTDVSQTDGANTDAPETDTRAFSSNFNKPYRLRLRHDGEIVYDKVNEGEVLIYLRDLKIPQSGLTELLLGDGEQVIATWDCREGASA